MVRILLSRIHVQLDNTASMIAQTTSMVQRRARKHAEGLVFHFRSVEFKNVIQRNHFKGKFTFLYFIFYQWNVILLLLPHLYQQMVSGVDYIVQIFSVYMLRLEVVCRSCLFLNIKKILIQLRGNLITRQFGTSLTSLANIFWAPTSYMFYKNKTKVISMLVFISYSI